MINKIFKVIAASIIFVGISQADLAPLSDDEMSVLTGQALLKIEETLPTSAQPNISFTRLTMGLKIEVNQTIDELVIGRYHREDGVDSSGQCHERGRFCDNVGQPFAKWNCSASRCGGITEDVFDGNTKRNPFSASAVVYGDILGLSFGDQLEAVFGALGGGAGAYGGGKPFTDSTIFPSGFEYTTDADVRLRDVSLGRVVHVDSLGNRNADASKNTFRKLEPFVFEKPFVEFAYDTSGSVKKIAGLRVGFGSATGTQGNAIDVLTGFVKPVVSAQAKVLGGVITGSFTFAPYLGGVRTPGYIDAGKSIAGPCSGGFLSSIICDKVKTPELIAEASPQAQLFPLQNVALKDSPAFWFSFQNQEVQYKSDKVTKGGVDYQINYETAKPGAWINLGAFGLSKKNSDGTYSEIDFTDSSNNLNLLTEVSGFSANTTQPKHPDNYFSANSANNAKYPQGNNYY